MLIPHYLKHSYEGSSLLAGAITGVFFLTGGVMLMTAFSMGPGGPVNALVCTQIIYQTIINALFFGQGISVNELGGICFGIAATLLITLGEDCYNKCFGAKKPKETKASCRQNLLSKDS